MTTLYEKIGRRYHPVAERDTLDSVPNGVWLVDIRDGRRFCMRAIDPGPTLECLAAIPALVELISAELVEHSRGQPSSRPTTAKEKRAWAAYCEVMGDEATLSLTRPSAYDVAMKVARRLAELAGSGTGRPAEPRDDARRRSVASRRPDAS